jgi:predicted membrane protein
MNETLSRDERCDLKWKKYQHSPTGKILAGIWVVVIGAVLLSKQMGMYYPEWLFTWPVMLMAIGIYIGARHLFCNPGWVILVIIGGLFLCDSLTPNFQLSTYIWPIVIMVIGIAMIFKPRRRHKHWGGPRRRHRGRQQWREYGYDEQGNPIPPNEVGDVNPETTEKAAHGHWHNRKMQEETSREDYLDIVSVFGGVRKNFISKTFKGGEITCVLGGAEVNFMQADIQGRVTLDVTCVLGGAKLIIPSHWDVQPETMAILGGIEDKRQMNNTVSADKVLVIKGTTCLGGIEIKSF